MFDVSAVIPVLNERDGLEACHRELSRVLSDQRYRYQLIFVDDGSTDGSWQRLEALQASSENTVCIRLRRHAGQQQALLVGLRFATGQAVVTYDADMQFAPESVATLAAKIHQGSDIAGGIRVAPTFALWTSRFPSRLARYFVNHVLQVNQRDFGAVKAYSRRLVNDILRHSHAGTVIPALAYTLSRNFIELPVAYRRRTTGRSKANFLKRAEIFLHVYASHARRPFRWAAALATVAVSLGILLAGASGLIATSGSLAVEAWLLGAAFLFVTGVELFVMALVGRLLVRTYRSALLCRDDELIAVVLGAAPTTKAPAPVPVDAY